MDKLYDLIEGDVCLTPSLIKTIKSDINLRREAFVTLRDEDDFRWLAQIFNTPAVAVITDYLNLDLV